MNEHLILIDGSAFAHRAYHSMPPFRRKSDDLNVGAVNGFCEMLWRVLKQSLVGEAEHPATHVAVVFDHKSKNYRHRIFPQYKANRKPTDPDLATQLPMMRHATKAFGVAQVELEGFEADDIIGTIARRMSERVIETTILSSDKDLMQLIGPLVAMWDPLKRKRIDSAAVYDKFGVYPSEVVDFLAICGDKVDNVPGLPGIGPKGAAALIEKFGSIEEILRRKDEIATPKQRQTVQEFEAQLLLSRQLVDLDLQVPVPFDLDAAAIRMPNRLNLVVFLRRMSLMTLMFDITRTMDRQPKEYVREKNDEESCCGRRKNPP